MRHITQAIEFSVLMIRSFPLLQPHFQLEAELMNLKYSEPTKITSTASKLRWYRHRKALLQSEVADYAGIHQRTYSHYEKEGKDYYPIDKLNKIAELFDVKVTDLMDEYNLFLYYDQGKQIKAKREAMGMTCVQYAKYLGIPPAKLRQWENNRVQIFKSTWEKYFK